MTTKISLNLLKIISIFIIVLSVFSPLKDFVFALTEAEFKNLSPEKLKVLPMIEAMSAMGVSEEMYYFILETSLLDLRYYYKEPSGKFSQELKKAIESFQSDVGYKANGILTTEQFEILTKRHNIITGIQTYPSPFKQITKVDDYVVANGTWVFENDKQTDPIQTSKIICSRLSNRCHMATAIVGMLGDILDDQASLYVDIEEWNITKWTEHEVQAENDEALCVSYTLSINLLKEEAFMFRRGKGGTNCEGIAKSPQILKLVGGFKVGEEFWKKRQDEANKVRSSSYQNLLKKFKSQ